YDMKKILLLLADGFEAVEASVFTDVLECYRVAGEISYIVKIATHSVESLEQFIDDSMQYGTPSTNIVLSSYEKKIITPFISEE
ncbi:Lrp/AsnC ligand binding domain-containing protein, partial [Bacillus thuringiensis]|nr:Lrp/AsnC ligand binding domain-containing protein [Bacillus thuringiensis]